MTVGPDLLVGLCICVLAATTFALWVYIEKVTRLEKRLGQLESQEESEHHSHISPLPPRE